MDNRDSISVYGDYMPYGDYMSNWYSWSGVFQTESLAEEITQRWIDQLEEAGIREDTCIGRTGSMVTLTYAPNMGSKNKKTRVFVEESPEAYFPRLMILKTDAVDEN